MGQFDVKFGIHRIFLFHYSFHWSTFSNPALAHLYEGHPGDSYGVIAFTNPELICPMVLQSSK